MKHISNFAVLVITMLCCTGCWPAHITTSPAAIGTVVDARTREPVSGAEVQLSYTWRAYWSDLNPPMLAEVITNTRPPMVLTDTNGVFSIPREHVWVFTYPLPDWNARGALVVEQDGYEPAIIPVTDEGDTDKNGMTVLLKPMQK